MMPPPIVTRLLGSSLSETAPSESITPGRSSPSIGGLATTEPVARIVRRVAKSAPPPALRSTWILPGATSVPCPRWTSILCAFINWARPPVSCLTTLSLCAISAAKSTSMPLNLMPSSAPRSLFSW